MKTLRTRLASLLVAALPLSFCLSTSAMAMRRIEHATYETDKMGILIVTAPEMHRAQGLLIDRHGKPLAFACRQHGRRCDGVILAGKYRVPLHIVKHRGGEVLELRVHHEVPFRVFKVRDHRRAHIFTPNTLQSIDRVVSRSAENLFRGR